MGDTERKLVPVGYALSLRNGPDRCYHSLLEVYRPVCRYVTALCMDEIRTRLTTPSFGDGDVLHALTSNSVWVDTGQAGTRALRWVVRCDNTTLECVNAVADIRETYDATVEGVVLAATRTALELVDPPTPDTVVHPRHALLTGVYNTVMALTHTDTTYALEPDRLLDKIEVVRRRLVCTEYAGNNAQLIRERAEALQTVAELREQLADVAEKYASLEAKYDGAVAAARGARHERKVRVRTATDQRDARLAIQALRISRAIEHIPPSAASVVRMSPEEENIRARIEELDRLINGLGCGG